MTEDKGISDFCLSCPKCLENELFNEILSTLMFVTQHCLGKCSLKSKSVYCLQAEAIRIYPLLLSFVEYDSGVRRLEAVKLVTLFFSSPL